MAPNDVWQLTVKGVLTETTHLHTLHFLETGASILGTELITAWSTAALTQYRGCFAIAGQPVQSIEARKVCGSVPLPSPDEVFRSVPDAAGTRATSGDPMPAYVACTVAEKGMNAGRRYSGRFFLGGLYETDVTGNDLNSSYTNLVHAYCDALTAAFIPPAGGLSWRLFCFSELLAKGDPLHTKQDPTNPKARVADPVPAVGACQLAGSPTKALVVNARPTTMRSRKYGHGS